MVVSQSKAFALIFPFVVVSLATFCFSEARGNGFSIDMFHRDSPDSPFYNPLETRSERLAAAFRRSIDRAQRFNPKSSVSLTSAEAPVKSDGGEYIVNISLGSPPFPISVIVDTGSDLIWTQCEPCDQCYDQTAPLFDPRKSRTYREISCESDICGEIQGNHCNNASTCGYSYSYGDQSSTAGVIAAETVTLGSSSSHQVALPKTIFGCGSANQGTFRKEGSGIVGLGGGPESLVSQMGSSIDGKFSYCLVPFSSYETSKTSKLHFGDRAEIAGESSVSTPLIKGDPATFYYLNLKAISVGEKRVENPDSEGSGGNIVIDSGTTLTLLPQTFYSNLESAVAEQIEMKRVEDPADGLSLCYKTQSDDIKMPTITVHFDGADLELADINTFIRISEDLVCFAFSPIDDIAIYGNIAQQNFLVGYNTVEQTVSFKHTDCTTAN